MYICFLIQNFKLMIYENYGILDCIEESFYFQLKGKKLRSDNIFWLGTQIPKVLKRLVRIKYKKDIEDFKPKETIFTAFEHHSDNILKDQVTFCGKKELDQDLPNIKIRD